MQWLKLISISVLITLVTGCSSWVYRMNIPQGNYLEQKDVDKLRIGMSKEQVIFVLGQPVAKDAFDNSSWHYIYMLNHNRDTEQRMSLIVHFSEEKLKNISGDYKQPEEFNTPLDL